jgi:hypothetical protein
LVEARFDYDLPRTDLLQSMRFLSSRNYAISQAVERPITRFTKYRLVNPGELADAQT